MYPLSSIVFCFVVLLTLLGGGTSQLGYRCGDSLVHHNENNIKIVLDDLVSNATRPGGFYKTKAGSGGSNTVYGRFICRGDISLADCQSCIEDAAKEVLVLCPLAEKAAGRIFYRQCTLDYSSNPMFGIEDIYTAPVVSCDSQISSEPQRFMGLLKNALNRMADAVAATSGKFATLEANVSSASKTMYLLGQCTPDLSKSECGSCLEAGIRFVPQLCYSTLGAEIILASCHIKYDMYPLSKILPSPPAPIRRPPVKGN
ncbi:unnamed protein product [Cuscuta campestris]|uniref:Gnk2-homologous domain-containing protein n=1 Tax=Cuscuta campestris TaxID=132261 RepID=A0A484K841_9ASTE|nr:unnamed protein product [Cuscuta campestris]